MCKGAGYVVVSSGYGDNAAADVYAVASDEAVVSV